MANAGDNGEAPVVIVTGPTAAGKSALAVDLAGEFQGTVINADSMQVYAELRVLTARPSPEDEAAAPHRLFGVMSADAPCSAGRWLAMAAKEIEKTRGAGRLAVVTGGTGLYLKVLTGGLADIPDVPADTTTEARDLWDRLGEGPFRDELARLDPVSAGRIARGDGQRLVRALAVVRATGRTLPQWQADQPEAAAIEARFATIAVIPERDALYAAIDARFDAMMAAGALDEVKALLELEIDPALPAMKAVGVEALAGHLRGETDLAEAVSAAKRASRNYAKRQLTWLRNQTEADLILAGAEPEDRERAREFVGRFLAD